MIAAEQAVRSFGNSPEIFQMLVSVFNHDDADSYIVSVTRSRDFCERVLVTDVSRW